MTTDTTWQGLIGKYLDAEFCHSAGDYEAAVGLLRGARDAAPAPSSDSLSKKFGLIVDVAETLSAKLVASRYAAGDKHRHPPAPDDLLKIGAQLKTFDNVHGFYAVGVEALDLKNPDNEDLTALREAILRNYDRNDAGVAYRIARRFEHRTTFAQEVLKAPRVASEAHGAEIDRFAGAGLDNDRGAVPAFVLSAFVQANINRYRVDHLRSLPVGKVLARTGTEDLRDDKELLKRSVALLTFVFALCLTCPWLFAQTDAERAAIMHPSDDKSDVDVSKPRWLASQLLLLSIYRRAHAFRLLREHQRSYNDLRKVQRKSRDERLPIDVTDARNKNLNTLEMLAEFRIGELYRADHDASQGLVHLCRSHDLVKAWQRYAGAINESALFQVYISLSKGKAFLEGGAVKRALKWFVRAWISLERLGGIEQPVRDPELVGRSALTSNAASRRPRPTRARSGSSWNCSIRRPDHPTPSPCSMRTSTASSMRPSSTSRRSESMWNRRWNGSARTSSTTSTARSRPTCSSGSPIRC